ncbi:hypothetical protein BDV93DRAFT_544582 [Ceratobasidium sp. AG-I]|nr:hypothetical protein BDV93DRAFT_544582 [Ceratobasidium sp. AG-I]
MKISPQKRHSGDQKHAINAENGSDAGQPCSTCWRTYRKTIRVNPSLKDTLPNCTYDQVLEDLWDQNELSQQNLSRLEARVEELEGQTKTDLSLEPDDVDSAPAPTVPQSRLPPEEPFNLPGDPSDLLASLNPFALPVLASDWPPSLPPKPLVFHLVDLFFTCCPNSRRIIHRPTFLTQLLDPPSSPHFPFVPLLHAICAVAAAYSPLVTVAQASSLSSKYLTTEPVFNDKTRYREGRQLMFDEENYVISRSQSIASAKAGENLVGATQASIIGSWWAFSCSRWFDHWLSTCTAMRLCVSLGFNLEDTLKTPLAPDIRVHMLIGPPQSHIEVELRRNIFWLSYCAERYHLFASHWPFTMNDEDIQQTLPGTLDAFETGVDDGQERQRILSPDLFTAHGEQLDDFGLYIKGAVILSRTHALQIRHFARYDTQRQAFNSRELAALNQTISDMNSSTTIPRFKLNEQMTSSVISNLAMVRMTSQLATLKSYMVLANWKDPGCESASRALAAARTIVRYITRLTSTSWDLLRLDKAACLCWSLAGRLFLAALEHAPEKDAPVLREEIKLIRTAYLLAGDRVVLFLHQRQAFDAEIVEQLGEREAAKLFQDDFYSIPK